MLPLFVCLLVVSFVVCSKMFYLFVCFLCCLPQNVFNVRLFVSFVVCPRIFLPAARLRVSSWLKCAPVFTAKCVALQFAQSARTPDNKSISILSFHLTNNFPVWLDMHRSHTKKQKPLFSGQESKMACKFFLVSHGLTDHLAAPLFPAQRPADSNSCEGFILDFITIFSQISYLNVLPKTLAQKCNQGLEINICPMSTILFLKR